LAVNPVTIPTAALSTGPRGAAAGYATPRV
jgi:hypothetical protein